MIDLDALLFAMDGAAVLMSWQLHRYVSSKIGKVVLMSLMLTFGYAAVSDLASMRMDEPYAAFQMPWRQIVSRTIILAGLAYATWQRIDGRNDQVSV